MSNFRVVSAVVTLVLCLAAAAQAADQPTVNAPLEGAVLGPNYEITGSLASRALVVVLTDAVYADTGLLLATVPGIRHYTNEDGTFHFRCASPRLLLGDETRTLTYRVRCFTLGANGETGPETVVNCTAAR